MGTKVLGYNYNSRSFVTMDNGTWHHRLFIDDKPGRRLVFDGLMTGRMPGYADYDKEMLKRTMIEQDIVFRKQVYELHRVYRLQKDLMGQFQEDENSVCATPVFDFLREDSVQQAPRKVFDLRLPADAYVDPEEASTTNGKMSERTVEDDGWTSNSWTHLHNGLSVHTSVDLNEPIKEVLESENFCSPVHQVSPMSSELRYGCLEIKQNRDLPCTHKSMLAGDFCDGGRRQHYGENGAFSDPADPKFKGANDISTRSSGHSRILPWLKQKAQVVDTSASNYFSNSGTIPGEPVQFPLHRNNLPYAVPSAALFSPVKIDTYDCSRRDSLSNSLYPADDAKLPLDLNRVAKFGSTIGFTQEVSGLQILPEASEIGKGSHEDSMPVKSVGFPGCNDWRQNGSLRSSVQCENYSSSHTTDINRNSTVPRYFIDLNCEPSKCMNEPKSLEFPPKCPVAVDLEMNVQESADRSEQITVGALTDHLTADAAADSLVTMSAGMKGNLDIVLADSGTEMLRWFADAIFSDDKILNTRGGNLPENSDVDGLDVFEFLTLRLEETKEDCHCAASSTPQPELENEGEMLGAASFLFSKTRGRQAKGRRCRRQKRDFQKDILPGLATLARHEVSEDLQTLRALVGPTFAPLQSTSSSVRRGGRNGGRGKGRPKTVPRLPVYDKRVVGWVGSTDRCRQRQCPASAEPVQLR